MQNELPRPEDLSHLQSKEYLKARKEKILNSILTDITATIKREFHGEPMEIVLMYGTKDFALVKKQLSSLLEEKGWRLRVWIDHFINCLFGRECLYTHIKVYPLKKKGI